MRKSHDAMPVPPEDPTHPQHGPADHIRVMSWNLLRLVGAGVDDVARLIDRHHPDLLLMQEATAEIAGLTALAGGHLFREPMARRIYGLAVWSPHPLGRPHAIALPVSKMPGRVPPRLAQIVRFGGATFANVHLSHGQLLNRRQLFRIAEALDGPAAIVGDYNAVGGIRLAGYRDIGPQQPTHTRNIVPFRLDRCMAHGIHCTRSRVLERGPSDHHPIILDLHLPAGAAEAPQRETHPESGVSGVGDWVRAFSSGRVTGNSRK